MIADATVPQRLHTCPHALPGQLQPVQRRHRRDHVRGVRALLPALSHQPVSRQLFQQRIQDGLFQFRIGDLAAELRQDRRVKPLIGEFQTQQILPVDPTTNRIAAERTTGKYRTHQGVLQELQWKGPRGRWTLKSPEHLFSLAGHPGSISMAG